MVNPTSLDETQVFETLRFLTVHFFRHPEPVQQFIVEVNMQKLGKWQVNPQKCIHVYSSPEIIEGNLGIKNYLPLN